MRLGLAALLMGACNGDSGDTPPTTDETGTPTTDTDTTTTSTGETRIQTILSLTPDTAAGETLYTMQCAACHMADGTGSASGANLTERVPQIADEDILTILLEGRGNMDSYRFLKNQELADVAAYVRESFGS